MKKIALSLLMIGFALRLAVAGEDAWMTDFAKAQAKAKEQKKLLLLDFTGSDWCPPCKALHANVLVSKEFEEFAKDNLVLLVVDFPRQKPQSSELKAANQKLSDKFSIEGYPTVILLDGGGRIVSKEVGYSGASAKDYVANLKKHVKN